MSTPEEDEERRRKAEAIWQERFARPAAAIAPGRQRLLRAGLLLLAALLLAGGLGLRSRRLADGRPASPPAGTELAQELKLDGAGRAEFLTRWEAWHKTDQALAAHARRTREALATLAGQEMDLNLEQERLLLDLRETARRRAEAQMSLVDGVRDEWGLWRASKLALLLEDGFPTP